MMIISLGEQLRNKWGNYQIIEFALISFLTDSQCPTRTGTNSSKNSGSFDTNCIRYLIQTPKQSTFFQLSASCIVSYFFGAIAKVFGLLILEQDVERYKAEIEHLQIPALSASEALTEEVAG
jgi:hypothetical protein